MYRAALTLLAPLLGAAVLVAWSAWRLGQPSDIEQAAAWVQSVAQPRDLVLVTPADRVLDLHHFDGLDVLSASTLPPELDRFDRVFLVRPTSDNPPGIQRMLGGRSRLLLAETFESEQVELFQMQPMPPLITDLSANIEQATVWVVEDDGERVDCPWNVDRFQCGDAPWTYVGATQQIFEGEPIPCVWAHPVDDATLHIEFRGVYGVERLNGWYGLTDYAVSIPDGRRVTLRVNAGDTERRYMARQVRGRTPIDVHVRGDDDGVVRLEVSSQSPGVRHLCWSLQALGSVPPAGEPGGDSAAATP